MAILLTLLLLTGQSSTPSSHWPPTDFQSRRTNDSVVALKTFHVQLRCQVRGAAGLLNISGQFPQLRPYRSFRTINDRLKQTVLRRVDFCEPSSQLIVETESEIFDECEVALRSSEFVSITCRVGWNGPAMGEHPDGEIEHAIYRIADGLELTKDQILRPEQLKDLRKLLEARFRDENPREFADASQEMVDEVLSWAMAAPLLTQDGVLFRYTAHHLDLGVTLHYDEAAPYLQPAILRAVGHVSPN